MTFLGRKCPVHFGLLPDVWDKKVVVSRIFYILDSVFQVYFDNLYEIGSRFSKFWKKIAKLKQKFNSAY